MEHRGVGSETIPASSTVAVVTSSTAAATTTTAAVGTNAIKEVATLTFSTTSSDHGADFAITNPTTNVPLSAGLGGVQTIDATTTALPTAATLGHPDNPNATQSATAKVVVRTGTPTTTSTTTATRMVDLEAGGDSSNCRGVHASVSDAVPRPLPHSVSAPNRIDCVAIAVAVVAETLNPTDITAGTLVSADPFPTTFPSTVSNPRGVEGVEYIANINPILLITRPVGNVYLVSTIVTLSAAGAVEDVDATDTADDDDADAAVIAATTPIHFAQKPGSVSHTDQNPSVSRATTYEWPNCSTPVSTVTVETESTPPVNSKNYRNTEFKEDSITEQDISFNSDTSIWTTGTEHTAVRWRSAPSRLGQKISDTTSVEYVSRLSLTNEEELRTLEGNSTPISEPPKAAHQKELQGEVGSETIPASSTVAVVTSSTAAATTTTAAVGTNAIREVATLTFSTTSSDHGADFAITNPTTNVPLSAGLGGVQTIDATTTALPTATTLGHPDNPNATQSATAKVVVRTGTPTTTSTTTATRMVDIEAGGSSSNCRRVHASVSNAVPRPLPRPLPHSVSAPNRIDCVAIAVAVAVVAETLNPTDITAGTLVSADLFPTTFPSTVSNPRGVEGVESIANINPILLITRPVGNVYLVSTIVTLPAAGAVHATDTADDDADAAVIAATTPIYFAYLACRCSRLP
ncbi:hypothetical protein SprV_0401452600 [Sparganum proliferum]